ILSAAGMLAAQCPCLPAVGWSNTLSARPLQLSPYHHTQTTLNPYDLREGRKRPGSLNAIGVSAVMGLGELGQEKPPTCLQVRGLYWV
ncbi:MAG: hypothetical protein EBZ18_04400, partial [Alphaproteobacteria bacterium]|nr:hypothetical protein [Alphaproteobacteria bacterium]